MPTTRLPRGGTHTFIHKPLILVAAASLIALNPLSVGAHQSPGNCNSNRLNLSIIKDKTEVRQGDVLTYTVTVSNLNGTGDVACDITDTLVTIQLPASDGTPTGQLITLGPDETFPSNSPIEVIGTAQYTVDVDPGVVDIVAEGTADGVLHDAPVDHSALIVKTVGTSVIPSETDEEAPGGGTGSGSAADAALRLPNTGSF